MTWKKKLIISALVIVAGLTVYNFNVRNSGPECSSLSYEQATETIKNDYLGRLNRWPAEVKRIGTDAPLVTFDRSGTRVTQVYFIPFTATGSSGTQKHFAMYTCKSGLIEYSTE